MDVADAVRPLPFFTMNSKVRAPVYLDGAVIVGWVIEAFETLTVGPPVWSHWYDVRGEPPGFVEFEPFRVTLVPSATV